MLVTPEMDENIVSSVLRKCKRHTDHGCVEMKECGIEPSMSLEKMKWKEVTDLLKTKEYKRLIGLGLARDIEHCTKVLEIEPQSANMILEMKNTKD